MFLISQERKLAAERGAFLKVVKFSEEDVAGNGKAAPPLDSEYTPLAKDAKKAESRGLHRF